MAAIEPNAASWNDDRGFELGGVGCGKTADGKYRVMLGLDDPQGEAVLLTGRAAPGNEAFGNEGEFGGLMVKDEDGNVVLDQNVLGK